MTSRRLRTGEAASADPIESLLTVRPNVGGLLLLTPSRSDSLA